MFRYLLFPVLNALGSVLAAFAALMLVPALYSWAEGDGARSILVEKEDK